MAVTVPKLQRFVGNPNAYAVQQPDGSYRPVRERLTAAVLRRHLDGEVTVGTYVLMGDLAKTLVFDVDEPDTAVVQTLTSYLTGLGLGYGVEVSGRKGWHIWVVARMWVPAHLLRRIGLQGAELVRGRKVEVFPKQDMAADLGNLVKLPWGVHRVTGARSYFEVEPPVVSTAAIESAVAVLPQPETREPEGPPPPFRCMEAIQAGVSEGQRNIALFHYVVMLRRAGVAPEFVDALAAQVNARFSPPLDDREVEATVRSAMRYGPLCRQLEGTSLHCGEDCLLRRAPGLYTRPGRVRFAAAGEAVVVRVAHNDGEVVEFEHEDLAQGWGRLKK